MSLNRREFLGGLVASVAAAAGLLPRITHALCDRRRGLHLLAEGMEGSLVPPGVKWFSLAEEGHCEIDPAINPLIEEMENAIFYGESELVCVTEYKGRVAFVKKDQPHVIHFQGVGDRYKPRTPLPEVKWGKLDA